MSHGFFHDLDAVFSNPYVALIFVAALAFDFINGFHDAANSIATIVGTRVMRPGPAVLWAAWWNLAAAWIFGLAVANTVAKWVQPEFVTPDVILAGLIGAIVWDLLTWYVGLPTSSSHALLGGFGGAAMAYAGTTVGVLHTAKVIATIEFIVLAPLIGFVLALALVVDRHPGVLERSPRARSTAGSASFSSARRRRTPGARHQRRAKTMGIIAALFYATIWRAAAAALRGRQDPVPVLDRAGLPPRDRARERWPAAGAS